MIVCCDEEEANAAFGDRVGSWSKVVENPKKQKQKKSPRRKSELKKATQKEHKKWYDLGLDLDRIHVSFHSNRNSSKHMPRGPRAYLPGGLLRVKWRYDSGRDTKGAMLSRGNGRAAERSM